MKVTIPTGAVRDYKIVTHFWEYNCAAKMVGNYTLVGPTEDRYQEWYTSVLEQNKKGLITEWLSTLKNKDTFTALGINNPAFAGHGSKYLPSALIYADSVGYPGTVTAWWRSFPGLIQEFQRDPTYGVKVFSSPMFHNRTFDRVPRPSRVWTLVLSDKILFTPKNSELRGSLDPHYIPRTEFYDERDKAEFYEALS